MPVMGICNGFQILCEAHLLPGALIRNDVRVFVCKDQDLRVESVDTTWTSEFTGVKTSHSCSRVARVVMSPIKRPCVAWRTGAK